MKHDERIDLTFLSGAGRTVELEASPQDLKFNVSDFALLVVDMQNGFLKSGGMLDRNGVLNIGGSRRLIRVVRKVVTAARRSGMRVIYLAHVYDKDHTNAGSTNSPNYWKEMGVVSPREHPEFARFRFLTEGSWDSRIVDELAPAEGDVVIKKSRYSGFTNPILAKTLRECNTKILGFVGIATNVCVESTLRDAYFSEYFPVLFEDACLAIGPAETQAATVGTVRACLGWTSKSRQLIRALAANR